MSQFQSTEELASSIATGIGNAASSIKSVGKVTMDASSEYPGNTTASERIPKETKSASSISVVLSDFVSLIQSTAAEFVAMDNQIASEIRENTSVLPATSAVPSTDSGAYAGGDETTFEPNAALFSEAE